ncbi:MAG: hypothetical protein JNM45_02465 [Rhizobiales bacterium]|nr:hypothetical protein [Hyphomicrobiales bacterium]
MLNKIAMASGLALLSLVAAPQAFAWDKIGSKNIGHGGDRDVAIAHGLEHHRQFRMCVRGSGVHVRDLDLRFANGGHQDISVQSHLGNGACTRVVDLKGNDRNIRKIAVRYERLRKGNKATATFWAR